MHGGCTGPGQAKTKDLLRGRRLGGHRVIPIVTVVKVTIGYRRSTTGTLGSKTEPPPSWTLPALCGLVVLAPFNLAPVTGEQRLLVVLRPLVILQLLISVAVVFAMLRARSGAGVPLPRALTLSAGGLVVMVSLSAVFSNDQVVGAGGAATALAFAATTVAAALVLRTPDAVDWLLRWLIGGAALGATIGLVVLVNGGEFWFTEPFVGGITRIGLTPRLTRPWAHANIAAMAIGPAASVLAAVLIGGRTLWHRVVDGLVLMVLVVSLVLTYSRGGLAGALLAMVVCAALLTRRFNRNAVTTGGLLLAVFGLAAVAMAAAPGWGGRFATEPSQGDFLAAVTPPPDLALDPDGATVMVSVENQSPRTWMADGPDRVQLSARLLVLDTDRIAGEQRWPLPDDVHPGEAVTLAVQVDQRVPDGRYEVLWDLLLDQEAYFLQFSDRSATSVITVIDSPVAAGATTPLVPPRTNLSRFELWRFAASAFAEQPLLGVGPMQLAAYAEPELSEKQRFPGAHAHNLPLEALATWGLLGAVPLFVLLVGGAYRAWRSALRGDNIGLVVLAGLIASAVHATVEWQVNEVSAALPMALLVGVGWATIEMAPTGTEGEKNERDSNNRAVSHPVP